MSYVQRFGISRKSPLSISTKANNIIEKQNVKGASEAERF